MRITSKGNETFLFINGIGVNKRVSLGNNIELLPAQVDVNEKIIAKLVRNQGDYGLSLIFLWLVKSQLCITSKTQKQLAIDSWNSLWDIVLLSALFDCDAVCNFQCNKPVEKISEECEFHITNRHLRGLTTPNYLLTDDDICWIEKSFTTAKILLDKQNFSNAVHCLATYHWHSLPNARLALLWSGIEGLFDIDSELVFRLSLYISRFLEGDNVENRKRTFLQVKQLYNQRSAAVHGTRKIKDPDKSVKDSAHLLRRIIIHCIDQKQLPKIEELAP